MNHNPVGWFEIYVQDMNRAKAFYEKTFNAKLEKLESPAPELEMWAFPFNHENPGAAGALVKMEGKDSGIGGVLIYFSCADCGQTGDTAAANGGAILRPKMSIGQYGFIVLVHDTEGNMIGLHSME